MRASPTRVNSHLQLPQHSMEPTTKPIENDERKAYGCNTGRGRPRPGLPSGAGWRRRHIARRFQEHGSWCCYFYPKADTPGCTIEAKDFSRLSPAFAKAGVAVVGVSADPVKKQDAFKTKHAAHHPPCVRRNPRDAAILRGLGRKIHVWKDLYGHPADHGPDRRRWPRSPGSGRRSRSRAMRKRCWRRPRRCNRARCNQSAAIGA